MEDDLRIRKKAVKDAKKAVKQRQTMPRVDDILADIEAIGQQATSFILAGDMDLPEDIEVVATGPVETVEFVQTASDGSVAADCSSGSCTCSAGFIDNGNRCEEMTEEKAATTQPCEEGIEDQGDGQGCQDHDECATDIHTCDINAA